MTTTYYDSNGRLHDKHVTSSNPYPTNNSFVYTGYAHLLNIPVNVVPVLQCFKECSTEFGYNRNPDGDIFPLSSHDEVVGLFMLMTKVGAKSLYEETKAQHFQVCNLPNFVPTPLYKLNPIKVVKDFWRLSREDNPRKATFKYPYIAPVVFRHMPNHTYFYSRCAEVDISAPHATYNFIASLITIFGGSNSSKVLLGFKLLKLRKLGQSPCEKLLTWIFNKRVDFAREVLQYFPTNHPIVEAVMKGNGTI